MCKNIGGPNIIKCLIASATTQVLTSDKEKKTSHYINFCYKKGQTWDLHYLQPP